MRARKSTSRIGFALGRGMTVALLFAASGALAEPRHLALDAAASEVTIDLPATGHDVHGAFRIRGGAIDFDPAAGTASGEIVVEAASGETGNGSRDKTMRDDVLEAPKFPDIRFVAERFVGDLPASGSGEVELVGKLSVHGAAHPLSLKAKVTVEGSRLRVKTTFPVPFLDWGMKDPSVLFLRVEPVVLVAVSAEGELSGSAVAGSL